MLMVDTIVTLSPPHHQSPLRRRGWLGLLEGMGGLEDLSEWFGLWEKKMLSPICPPYHEHPVSVERNFLH